MIDQLPGMQQLIQHSDRATFSFGAKLLKRRIPSIITVLSLLLTCGILMSWVRSFFVLEYLTWTRAIAIDDGIAQYTAGLQADFGMLSIYRVRIISSNSTGIQSQQSRLWTNEPGWSYKTIEQPRLSWEILKSSVRRPGTAFQMINLDPNWVYTQREFLIPHWLLALLTSSPAMIILLRRLIRRRRLRQTGFEVVLAPR